MPQRTANAAWSGGLRNGSGRVSVPRGGFEASYTFSSRFEEGQGLSPEDLIAAAHASCFSMAFAAALEKAGHAPDTVQTAATVTLEQVEGAPTISTIHLDTTARVASIDEADFQQQAEEAKQNCPVSRLYKGANITLSAKLEK